ncbi:MAG: ABC transporter ATP-binding protein/permease [Oscillospiraceae bacterium]|jgi:ATP-binding cassette subfamily B protein|nr:ABC transporter ATP-binding protein/permease [Oscillospiraceae bacterium]
MGLYGKYLPKYKKRFIAGVLCVACEAFCDLLGPTLMSRVINDGVEPGSLNGVLVWGGWMLLVTAFGAGFAVTRNILASRVSQRIGAELRSDLFVKIMNFSEADADKIESGSLITRMTNDTAQVTQFINGVMRVFLKAPINCIGSIVLASALNLRLSLIIYGVAAVVGTLIVISMKLSYPRFAALQKATDRLNTAVQEHLIGVRLVKAFGTVEQETARFWEANDTLRQRGVASQKIITLTSPVMTLAVGLGSALAIFWGSRLFEAELARPGDISAFIIYMAQILTSLLMITNIFNTFVRTRASAARIGEVFACGDDFQSLSLSKEKGSQTTIDPLSADGERAGRKTGSLVFEDVTFCYPGSSVPAVKNLSFSVAPGESLAIIGPTGSGKSTVCWLSLRFYDVNSGRILLDGTDIRELPAEAVRSQIAIAPQKAALFSGSVSDNLRWGDADATEEQMREAAARAQAGFIEEMSAGYGSPLGAGGVNLSGGQKQRVSIARALLKRAPVLILDDATGALDAITEAKVRKELLAVKQTLVTVTQRCTTAMFADKILVLENGETAGFGTHTELMETCEIYRQIYQSQVDKEG